MNIASIKTCDCANGPGMRVSIFVSGCHRHCPGCFNEAAWDFDYGTPFTIKMRDQIRVLISQENVDGVSILGGEPFDSENLLVTGILSSLCVIHHKNLWIYTGYTFEELLEDKRNEKSNLFDPSPRTILGFTDVLVDGPFVEAEKDISLRFRGSRNQRIIDVQASLKTGNVVLMDEWM